MAEAVAVADGEYGVARRDFLHELRARRGRAAVMGYEQRDRLKQARKAPYQLALGGALDVPREQHPASAALDSQHATAVVSSGPAARRHFVRRMEEFECDPVPKP